MKKLLFQFSVLLLMFFTVFFGLSRVDWMTLLQIEKASRNTEEKLGDLIWEMLEKTEDIIKDDETIAPVDSLLSKICRANDIDRSKIKLHLIQKDEVNAFALPDNRLLIYSGLILDCENQEELCGVIGHELAHIENKHVMKKLIKEIGLSVLITITAGGGGGGELLKQAMKLLSSSAYDRSLESEADIASVDYLLEAEINPAPFAEFLFRMAEEAANVPDLVYWITTHPESEERSIAIFKYLEGKQADYQPVLTADEWNSLKEKLKD